jgi:hypothetical protein
MDNSGQGVPPIHGNDRLQISPIRRECENACQCKAVWDLWLDVLVRFRGKAIVEGLLGASIHG